MPASAARPDSRPDSPRDTSPPRPPERIPVIVAVGESIDRPGPAHRGLDPVALMAEAARAADADGGGGWLGRVDRVEVVNQFTWPYADAAAAARAALALPARTPPVEFVYHEIGGETPVKLLMQAAAAIVAGEPRTTLVCGAEAMHSMRALAQDAAPPPGWPTPVDGVRGIDGSLHVSALAREHDLRNPIEVYSLYEQATRAAWGQSAAQARAESAALWAEYAAVAAHNPIAWSPAALDADAIVRTGPKNRPLSFPYCKHLVAQIFVNQGAAFIVTSLAQARAQGIAEDRLAYVWSGAGAADRDDFLERDRYDRSAPMRAVLDTTLQLNGLQARDFDLVELYSCFPCVPRMALRVLGGLRAGVAPTVAGGLSFMGGPGNNYMAHAIAAMVRRLRGGAQRGLLYGQGGFVSKHHATVLARAAPPRDPVDAALTAGVLAATPAVALARADYAGAASVETYRLRLDADGRPVDASIVARTPDGRRALAHVGEDDPEGLQALLAEPVEAVGRTGTIHITGGRALWRFTR